MGFLFETGEGTSYRRQYTQRLKDRREAAIAGRKSEIQRAVARFCMKSN